ncbi:MAG TPA: DMT family transporter [Chloroflexota bacterium]
MALPVAVAAVSTSGILIRLTTAPPLVTAANRMLLAGFLLLVWAALRGPSELPRALRQHGLLLALSGLLLGIHFALWTASLFLTSVASAVFLVDTHPALTALLARIALGELSGPALWLGILLTALGGAIIGGGDFQLGGPALPGDLMALGASVAFAGYLVIGRHVRADLDVAVYAGLVYGIAGILLALAAVLSGSQLSSNAAHDAPLWLALVLVPTLAGHTVFNWALRHVQTSVVAVSVVGEPVGTTLLAWWLLAQQPQAAALLGGATILVGLWLALKGH